MNPPITPSATSAPANMISREDNETPGGNSKKVKEENDDNKLNNSLDQHQRGLHETQIMLEELARLNRKNDASTWVAVVERRMWGLGGFLVDVFVQFVGKLLALRVSAWMGRRAAAAAVSVAAAKATATAIATATATATAVLHDSL